MSEDLAAPKPVRAKALATDEPAKEPIAELLDWNGSFFEKVRERETNPALQERLKRRLEHPICVRCQGQYRKKFPGQAFAIECQGIYAEPDFQELVQLTGMPYEQVRESLDIPYWAGRHISMPNADGDLIPFRAREYQLEALLCTARRQVDRWGRGLGKALAINTPIPTPNGWTTQGELEAGQFVFGPDGKPTEVLEVLEVHKDHKCFDVVFDDESRITADAEHLWSTDSKQGKRTLTTQELYESVADEHSIQRPASVVMNGKRVLISHRTARIISVFWRPPVPVRCIRVAHPSHLYLAGRKFTPTHNTTTGVIRELHTVTNRKRYEILVACPMKAQAQKWFDELNKLIDGDAELKLSVAQRKQAPYFLIRFYNGSTISIFTTGSKSGADADSVRSQSPKRVRIDEQDMLNPGDYKAIMPLLRRYPKESEFHGSSTPVGKREDFWAMCTQFPDYRELHFPIMVHPDWNDEMEEACRREARTELNYIHEWLAEFGDQEGGCFRAAHVDASLTDYKYEDCRYNPQCNYVLGIDWNGQGTGSRFRVVEFDPQTKKRRTVDSATVNISTMATMTELRNLNRKWHCDHVFVDAGFGYVQDELIRMIGQNSNQQDDRRLLNVHVVDFGAKLETNKLVPKRDKSKYIEENELERPTKPFMVEGAVMAMESGLIELSRHDKPFEEQVRAYRVKNYTKNGWASTYISDIGDHDLDAWMLAMLGIEIHYGISHVEKQVKPAAISHVGGFGSGDAALQGNPLDWQRAPESARAVAQKKANVPGRQVKPSNYATDTAASNQTQVASRDIYGNARGYVNRPQRQSPYAGVGGGTPSRTGSLTGGRTGAFGRNGSLGRTGRFGQ